MKENYYALVISILGNCTPEQAFEVLQTGRKKKGQDMESISEMIKLLNSGYGYKRIGEIYGLSSGAVYNRIKRAQGIVNW